MTVSLLEIVDLYRFYHPGETEVRALRGVSLGVAAGETVALVGPSGSGKSTLLACAAGLDEPAGGTVTIGGRRLTRRSEAERAAIRAASIGMVAQSGNLFGHLTLGDNIRLRQELAGRRATPTVAELLDRVGLADRAEALPGTLSGGELARGALAVALAVDPPLLVADEPTSEVDAETEHRILNVIEERRRRGGAALIATHSLALSARATRVLTIRDGVIAAGTPPSATGPGFGQSAEPGRFAGVARQRPGQPILVSGERAERTYVSGSTRTVALAAATFQVNVGDRIAIMGPSGSGKTTLLHLMAGLDHPTSGTVAWPGLDAATSLRPSQVGLVFQSPSLIPSLSVIENVRLPLALARSRPSRAMDPRQALDAFGLGDLADMMPDELSGGQLQRVGVARALVAGPGLLLADEPTGQLDQSTAQRLFDDLERNLAGTDTALVVATHDPAVANRLDLLWRMDKGSLDADCRAGDAA